MDISIANEQGVCLLRRLSDTLLSRISERSAAERIELKGLAFALLSCAQLSWQVLIHGGKGTVAVHARCTVQRFPKIWLEPTTTKLAG
jgi:hypothetical protein